MRAFRDRRELRGPVGVRTPRELLVRVGRLALWVAVGLLLMRGLGATLGLAQEPRESRVGRVATTAVWPDDAARALAVEFANAYLMHVPGEDP